MYNSKPKRAQSITLIVVGRWDIRFSTQMTVGWSRFESRKNDEHVMEVFSFRGYKKTEQIFHQKGT